MNPSAERDVLDRRGLEGEPLGGADALAKHTLGSMAVPSRPSGDLTGVVADSAAAVGAAVTQAATTAAGAAKKAVGGETRGSS